MSISSKSNDFFNSQKKKKKQTAKGNKIIPVKHHHM